MVARPRDPFGEGPSLSWRSSLEIFTIQLVTVAMGVGVMLVTPLGLSPLFFWAAGAMLFGAWAWAVRIGRPGGLLVRPALQVVARRTAALCGVTVGFAYVAIALVPGQIDLPWFMVGVVALTLAVGGGFGSLVLTLCGLDAARGEDPTSPPAS